MTPTQRLVKDTETGKICLQVNLASWTATLPLPDEMATWNKEQIEAYCTKVVPDMIEGLKGEAERRTRKAEEEAPMKTFHIALSKLRGRNSLSTPIEVIKDQMTERRPLPMGRQEFHEWADRIISGALLQPGPGEDLDVFHNSQKFALANMLMHLGPTESYCDDAHFIHSLRKFAVNQVADTIRREISAEAKARLAAEEAKAKANGEATVTDIGAAKA